MKVIHGGRSKTPPPEFLGERIERLFEFSLFRRSKDFVVSRDGRIAASYGQVVAEGVFSGASFHAKRLEEVRDEVKSIFAEHFDLFFEEAPERNGFLPRVTRPHELTTYVEAPPEEKLFILGLALGYLVLHEPNRDLWAREDGRPLVDIRPSHKPTNPSPPLYQVWLPPGRSPISARL